MQSEIYIGIDVGTSGCRACAIDSSCMVIATAAQPIPSAIVMPPRSEQHPDIWWQAVTTVLQKLRSQLPHLATAIAIDATSSTLLLTDTIGNPLTNGIMYNDSRATKQAAAIAAVAPAESAAHGSSSALAKYLWLQQNYRLPADYFIAHQADWLTSKLCGRYGITDENNALKLGYDPIQRSWPEWLQQLIDPQHLPEVVAPGTYIGTINPQIAQQLQLHNDTQIISGTTDSVAACIATGANKIGDAVTSLGSTLALKIISPKPIFAADYGIYSHRLWDRWLAGGASNSGGSVLLHYFSRKQLQQLTPQLQPDSPTGLSYYPLLSAGERFPIADATLQPKLQPRPESDAAFLQGIFEGIANIEATGYKLLHNLGAMMPSRLFSVGGGAANTAWQQIRQRYLPTVTMVQSQQQQAAYGAALLAKRGEETKKPL